MEENLFKVRAYTKADLAMMYNPEQCMAVALKTLSRWVQTNPNLKQELEEMNYNKYRRTFTPKEVDAIVRHLGEP